MEHKTSNAIYTMLANRFACSNTKQTNVKDITLLKHASIALGSKLFANYIIEDLLHKPLITNNIQMKFLEVFKNKLRNKSEVLPIN